MGYVLGRCCGRRRGGVRLNPKRGLRSGHEGAEELYGCRGRKFWYKSRLPTSRFRGLEGSLSSDLGWRCIGREYYFSGQDYEALLEGKDAWNAGG